MLPVNEIDLNRKILSCCFGSPGGISSLSAPSFQPLSCLWFAAVLAAFCVRGDLRGVMSFLRALGLRQQFYDRRVDFFHSPAVVMPKLTSLWTDLVLLRVLKHHLLTVNGFQAAMARLGKTPLNLGTDNASAANCPATAYWTRASRPAWARFPPTKTTDQYTLAARFHRHASPRHHVHHSD